MEKEQFENNQSIHKYFAIIPYLIIEKGTAYEVMLYSVMLKIAGENKKFYMTNENLAKEMGVCMSIVQRTRKTIEKKGWIRKIGKKKTLHSSQTFQKIDVYEIVDLWKENIKFIQDKYNSRVVRGTPRDLYPRVIRGTTLERPRVVRGTTLDLYPRVVRGTSNIESRLLVESIKELDKSNSSHDVSCGERVSSISGKSKNSGKKERKNSQTSIPENFNWSAYLNTMLLDPKSHVRIIARFFKKKKITFSSRAQVQNALKRHFCAAKSLVPFSDHDLDWAATYCKNKWGSKDVDWTLDTMLKALTSGNRNSDGIEKKKSIGMRDQSSALRIQHEERLASGYYDSQPKIILDDITT